MAAKEVNFPDPWASVRRGPRNCDPVGRRTANVAARGKPNARSTGANPTCSALASNACSTGFHCACCALMKALTSGGVIGIDIGAARRQLLGEVGLGERLLVAASLTFWISAAGVPRVPPRRAIRRRQSPATSPPPSADRGNRRGDAAMRRPAR